MSFAIRTRDSVRTSFVGPDIENWMGGRGIKGIQKETKGVFAAKREKVDSFCVKSIEDLLNNSKLLRQQPRPHFSDNSDGQDMWDEEACEDDRLEKWPMTNHHHCKHKTEQCVGNNCPEYKNTCVTQRLPKQFVVDQLAVVF